MSDRRSVTRSRRTRPSTSGDFLLRPPLLFNVYQGEDHDVKLDVRQHWQREASSPEPQH